MKLLFLILLSPFIGTYAQKKCIQKNYRGPDNPMNCVCNATYCDEFPPLGTLGINQAAIYTSSQSGKRFERTNQNFNPSTTSNAITISINFTRKFQKIIGFGGAFTDAVGINLVKLSPSAQGNLIGSYFGPEGIGYTVARTPMASCDFSARVYSYDDVDGDLNLTNFALTEEDFKYKIPFIKMAQNLIGDKFKLFASPWSAPGWMKITGKMQGGGTLIGAINGTYYQTWANYFVRYFEEYAKSGITFWGVTMQNEPDYASNLNYKFQAMYFNATMENQFAKGFWGQTLRSNPLTKNLKLMICDIDRWHTWEYAQDVFGSPEGTKYADGLAIHWYGDSDANLYTLGQVHDAYPDKFQLYTESTNEGGVKFGEWSQGDKYIRSIIQVLRRYVGGWTDWNMALDPQGGPNWVNNFCDSPIIVSNTTDEFEKQPMYYALGHIAKFLVPDSVVVELTISGVNETVLDGVAGITPTGQNVVVLNNRDVNTNYQVSLANEQGALLNLVLEARSFTTIVWNS